jgi:copper chaperone CopZ
MIARLRLSKPRQRTAILILGLALANAAAAAGLAEVKQTIFGMDCAPCAHGIETGLSKIEGVQDVTVSLNDGYALVKLRPDNAVTLEQIRLVIRENGFTPKDATLVVSGTLTRVDDRLVLATNTHRRYSLVATPGAQSAFQTLQTAPEGAVVQIEARVGAADTSRLSVLAVRSDRLTSRNP